MPDAVVALLVDFASTRDPHLYRAEVGEGDAVEVGTETYLFDHEGNACYGVVERLNGQIAWVRPIPGTWFESTSPLVNEPTIPTPRLRPNENYSKTPLVVTSMVQLVNDEVVPAGQLVEA